MPARSLICRAFPLRATALCLERCIIKIWIMKSFCASMSQIVWMQQNFTNDALYIRRNKAEICQRHRQFIWYYNIIIEKYISFGFLSLWSTTKDTKKTKFKLIETFLRRCIIYCITFASEHRKRKSMNAARGKKKRRHWCKWKPMFLWILPLGCMREIYNERTSYLLN